MHSSIFKTGPGQGIFPRSNTNPQLRAYCDSNWASCPITRHLSLDIFISLSHSPISWKSKKQLTVSQSSTKAEYRSMALTCYELKWLRYLLRDLCIPITRHILLFCDNQAALYIASNPVYHERTKHIEDCHFVRNELQANHIVPAYISTSKQPADIFTKVLGASQFHHLPGKLGIRDLCPQLGVGMARGEGVLKRL